MKHKWRSHVRKDITNETTVADVDSQTRTVGCVAVDNEENLASATSTGGMVNKVGGKIGDTPVIGAGTFASSLGAASATGKGEEIIQGTVLRDVAPVMEDLSLKEEAAYVIAECICRSNVEWFAVSAKGEVTMTCNTTDILRACATKDGYSEIGK